LWLTEVVSERSAHLLINFLTRVVSSRRVFIKLTMIPRAGVGVGSKVNSTWNPRTFQRLQSLVTDAFQSSDLSLLESARSHFDAHLGSIKQAPNYPGKDEGKRSELAKNGSHWTVIWPE